MDVEACEGYVLAAAGELVLQFDALLDRVVEAAKRMLCRLQRARSVRCCLPQLDEADRERCDPERDPERTAQSAESRGAEADPFRCPCRCCTFGSSRGRRHRRRPRVETLRRRRRRERQFQSAERCGCDRQCPHERAETAERLERSRDAGDAREHASQFDQRTTAGLHDGEDIMERVTEPRHRRRERLRHLLRLADPLDVITQRVLRPLLQHVQLPRQRPADRRRRPADLMLDLAQNDLLSGQELAGLDEPFDQVTLRLRQRDPRTAQSGDAADRILQRLA